MNLHASPVEAIRRCAHNPLSTALASTIVSLSFVPFLLSLGLGRPIAILGGLWATCLLFGLSLVALFRFATTVVEQDRGVRAIPHLVATVRRPLVGIELGVGTFVVFVSVAAVVGLSPEAFRGIGIGVGGTLLLYWYLLVAFAVPELGAGRGLRSALRRSGDRLLQAPGTAIWFLALSALFTIVAGITLLLVILYLAGVLGLLAAQIATDIEE